MVFTEIIGFYDMSYYRTCRKHVSLSYIYQISPVEFVIFLFS